MAEYGYERYFGMIRSVASRPDIVPHISGGGGMNLDEDYIQSVRARAEEAMRRQWWEDVTGGLHSSGGRAGDASNAFHQAWGLPDCASGNWKP